MSSPLVLVHGPPGVGKTEIMKEVFRRLSLTGRGFAVALTGVAAVNLVDRGLKQARTFHSWAGLGLFDASVDECVHAILNDPALLKRWKETDFLLIDELSMEDGVDLQKFHEVAIRVRCAVDSAGPARPSGVPLYGGIEVKGFADVFQLGPVPDTDGCFSWFFEAAAFHFFSIAQLSVPKRFISFLYTQGIAKLCVFWLQEFVCSDVQCCHRHCPSGGVR